MTPPERADAAAHRTPPVSSPSSTPRRVLVAGASGFVGRRLAPALAEAGHKVVAMTRKPEKYDGVGDAVFGDVHDPSTLPDALAGCEVAYYLVHSLASADFERLDREAARAFGKAAADAGVQRIVYLGGLGKDDDDLSPHLRSRREVEKVLGEGGVPVTTLRAGIVIGHEGLSWEMTRQLVERLPAMVTPRWVSTRTQPISLDDVVRYLVGVLDVPETEGRPFEVGGDEVLRYVDMMRRVADIENRALFILPVPLLSPKLSSHWLSLITDVDTAAGRSLVDSMVNEVVVEDDSIAELVPFERMSFDDAVRQALRERGTLDAEPGLLGRLKRWIPMSLTHQVPVKHDESLAVVRRRRRVVGATSVVGAGLLGFGLSTKPGSGAFYGATLATAAVYTVGGFASGPLHLGWVQLQDRTIRRPVLTPLATGVGAFGVFYAGGLVVREVPPLPRAIASVLQYSEQGNNALVLTTTLANGAAEEVFFRGAVFAALGDKHPVATSTGVYMLATVPTRNPVLVLAAGAMGALWGLQRRASNGLQAPVVTHLTWSTLMLRFLPQLFRDDVERSADARVI
jgi:uncharacterized protein YbjT (DUF2867 family)/membrane protease YdiL (CAAX protease family)